MRKSKGFTPISKAATPSSLTKKKNYRANKDSGFWARVVGISMWPCLRDSQMVWVEKTPAEFLDSGDVVVLKSKDRMGRAQVHVHRIIGRAGPFFIEAGDNSFSCGLVKPGDVLGRVVYGMDENGRKFSLSSAPPLKRFYWYREMATAFVLLHEIKDRILGQSKSKVLWKLSSGYRAAWRWIGIEVPLLFPSDRMGSVAKDWSTAEKFHSRKKNLQMPPK